jgi:prepilin-type processing-associated H-X9-DG protein
MNTNITVELADLEPVEEVKGGGGTALPSVTDLIIDPFNPNRVLAGSKHPGGINVCLADGSVR